MNNSRNNRGARGPVKDDGIQYRNKKTYAQDYDEYWEDEEDYEEYARAMDREYGYDSMDGDDYEESLGGRAGGAGRRPRQGSSGGSRKQVSARGEGKRPQTTAGRRIDGVSPSGRKEPGTDVRGTEGPGTSAPKKKRRKKKKGVFGIILRILVILLLIAVIVAGVIAYKLKDVLDVLEMQRVDSVDLEEELRQNMNYQAKNDQMMEGYQNIALFGVDSRSGDLLDGDNRSDTIMIASIHQKTGEIRLVSVYRDTVLDVGDGYYTKANTAYALGGPAQAINMLNQNLDLNILDFVTVGFEGLAHTIDALGGIEIEIDEEEREYLNQYVHDMHLELGTDETPVEESGLVTLTGIQATAYSRIRYTAGDDFRRAERQRTVLEKTLQKAKSASPTTLVDVANSVVGDMATSLSSGEIVSLILMAARLDLTDTGGIPQEDHRNFTDIEAGSAVMPDTLEDNAVWLHRFLFGDNTYTISEEVSERNDWMINNLQPAMYY